MQVEFRSHFSEKKVCLWAGKYGIYGELCSEFHPFNTDDEKV
jgi:hypothetical protein